MKLGNSTCLVIEDSRTQSLLLSRRLTELGCTPVVCSDMRQIRRLSHAEDFDLALVDLYLDEGKSIDHLDELTKRWPKTPIAVMSAGGAGEHAYFGLEQARKAGADFTLVKPFSVERLGAILTDALAMKAGRGVNTHVLIVDDSPFVHKVVAKMLRDYPCRLTFSSSMEDALNQLMFDDIDVVVTDIFMPGMGGIAGIDRMRSTQCNLGVVAMSGGLDAQMSDGDALHAARKIGADTCLSKPFSKDDLWEAILTAQSMGPSLRRA